jgi:competence protein ComEA
VNINTASAAELESLPEIGPVIAQNIIDYREANGPFTSIEAIQEVPEIGVGKFEAIRNLITVSP